MPDLLDFMFYSLYNANFKSEYLGKSSWTAKLCNAGIQAIELYRGFLRKELEKSSRFDRRRTSKIWPAMPPRSSPWATRPARDGS